jgi:hypothetical protein
MWHKMWTLLKFTTSYLKHFLKLKELREQTVGTPMQCEIYRVFKIYWLCICTATNSRPNLLIKSEEKESHNPISLHGLLRGIALLCGDGVCFL